VVVKRRTGSVREDGFSIVELMIALTITLVISASIYALIAAGQSAFAREPRLSDRQQNIRVALAMIERDVHGAGLKMGSWVQAFRVRHGASDTAGTLLNARGWNGTDELVINGADENCPDLLACVGAGADIFTYEPVPDCFLPGGGGGAGTVGLVWIAPGPAWSTVGRETSAGEAFAESKGPPGGGNCGGGGHMVFPMGEIGNDNSANFCKDPTKCNRLIKMQIIRYEVELDPIDSVPSLYRSTSGGMDANAVYVAPPAAAGNWQLVARGIDDMQIQYTMDGAPPADCPGGGGAGVPANCPAVVVPNTYGTITREVLITLSATTTGSGRTGESRGSLFTSVSPRAALYAQREGKVWR
jgi:prepilin-type N-terminal cleavage/methylation domain-containing protein